MRLLYDDFDQLLLRVAHHNLTDKFTNVSFKYILVRHLNEAKTAGRAGNLAERRKSVLDVLLGPGGSFIGTTQRAAARDHLKHELVRIDTDPSLSSK
jgi:hypothetical protein